MPTFPFTTVDVFTKDRYTGNPLAIVTLPADHDVSDSEMLKVAQEFNLSETVFIHEPTTRSSRDESVPEWRLRIFMTASELPFAGHPTIGSAVYALGTLAQSAGRGRLMCNAGPIEVEFNAGSGVARASIPHNFHLHSENRVAGEEVARVQPALGTVESVDVVSPVKGMNFLAVRLASLEELGKVKVTGLRPEVKLDAEWDVGFVGSYFYVVNSSSSSPDGEDFVKVQTRMIEGNMEDPATGSAACGLSCFLALEHAKRGRGRKVTKFEVLQGVEMGRRSEIGVEVTSKEGGGEVERVVLSGCAVGVMEGKVQI